MGYNEPTSFAYWSEGLHPLFAKTALGHLPHQVRQASHLRKLSHCFMPRSFISHACTLDWKLWICMCRLT